MPIADAPARAGARPNSEPAFNNRPFSWKFTAPLFIGSALNPVNSSLIATALIPIAHGLHVPIGSTAALVVVLYLASAIAQPTAGKAAEVFGARRIFLLGIALVAVGGLVGGFAQDLTTLLVSRILIGVGTSCAYPTAMLLIRNRAQEAKLDAPPGGVLGGLQAAAIGTSSLGLPVGGVLVGVLGWRSVFFINVPLAAIALIATLVGVAPDNHLDRKKSARDLARDMDVVGIAGFAAAMVAVLVFVLSLPTVHWYLLAVSIVLWGALVTWESHATTPFLDVRLLATNRALSSTYLRFGLSLLCTYVVLYGLTQWLETVRGLSETESGLLVLPMTMVSAAVIAPFSRRNMVRTPILIAAVACLVASAAVLLLTSSIWIGWIVLATVIFGVVIGASSAGNQAALYSQVTAEQLGTASGLLRTSGYIGSIASSAITGIVFHTRVTDHGLHTIGLIMVGVSVALVVTTVFAVSRRSLLKPEKTTS